jgi:hypothetical protein
LVFSSANTPPLLSKKRNQSSLWFYIYLWSSENMISQCYFSKTNYFIMLEAKPAVLFSWK